MEEIKQYINLQMRKMLEIFEKIIKFDIFFQEKEFKKSKLIFSYIASFFNWFYCIKKSISLFIIIYFIPTYVIFFIYWYIYQKSIHNLATSMMFP